MAAARRWGSFDRWSPSERCDALDCRRPVLEAGYRHGVLAWFGVDEQIGLDEQAARRTASGKEPVVR